MQPLDDRVLARYATSLAQMSRAADVAQLAEQLICNQQVASSILAVSSVGWRKQRRRPWCCASGGVPKWLNGADCKSAGYGLRRFESYPHHCVSLGGRSGRWRRRVAPACCTLRE